MTKPKMLQVSDGLEFLTVVANIKNSQLVQCKHYVALTSQNMFKD